MPGGRRPPGPANGGVTEDRGQVILRIKEDLSLQGKNQPTATFDRTPPPPGQQLSAKLGKM